MRRQLKRWKISILVTILIVMVAFAPGRGPRVPVEMAVAISQQTITNPLASDRVFRLFSVTNSADYDVRWHGDRVEVEGSQDYRARIVNSKLPGQKYTPVLKAGQSFVLNVGEPFYPDEEGRWRFTMSFTRYDAKERWHDLVMQGKVPSWIAKRVRVDSQKILNPTNHTSVSTEWFSSPKATVRQK